MAQLLDDARLLANLIRDKNRIKAQIGDTGEEKTTVFVHDIDFVQPKEVVARVTVRTITGTNIFILGHSAYGILGTGKLGVTDRTSAVSRVLSPDNTFQEYFVVTDFNDTTVTTANFDTTNERVDLDINEIYQTKEIFMNNASISAVTITATLNDMTTMVTITGGTGGQQVTLN